MNQTEERMRAGDLDGAAVLLWAVIRRDPAHGPARRDLARVYVTRGSHILAAAETAQALALVPRDSESHCVAGVLAASRGRPGEARRHLEEALARDPENGQAAQWLRVVFGAP